jgi:competence protein ComFB
MVKNYMEHAVEHTLSRIMNQMELNCSCKRCLEDIKAITLNRLKPHYVVSDEGELFAKVNHFYAQNETNIIAELISASKLVNESPKH